MLKSDIKFSNNNKFNKKIDWRKTLKICAFLAPAVICFSFFKYYTALQSIYLSFFEYDFGNPPGKFIGFVNYVNMFTNNPDFYFQLKNTLIIFLFGMLFGFWVPIVQALFLNELTRGKNLLKYLYILPAAIPGVAGLAIWRYVWNPEFGLANAIISIFGVAPKEWLLDPELVKITLRLPGLLGGGIGMLIYLVSISNIGEEIYESAKIDGASAFRRIISITIPNIMGMIRIQLLLAISGSLLAFDDVIIMVGENGGPGGSAKTIVMGIYEMGYRIANYGLAMAMSVFVLLLTLVFVILKMKFEKKE